MRISDWSSDVCSSDLIGANEALRIGLVDEVAQDWLGAAVAMGERIAANSPLAVQLIKQAISVGLESSLDAGLRVEAAALGLLATAEDRAEGLTAHLQKRSPEWKGR